jgi:Ni,Fe-hydrogenase III large subunit
VTQHAALDPFFAACRELGLAPDAPDPVTLAPALALPVPAKRWGDAVAAAKAAELRFCALWAQETGADLETLCCFEIEGTYLVLRASLDPGDALPSIAPSYCAADRPERHAGDLLGVRFADQPDTRRWTRHQAWTESEYPLRTGSGSVAGRGATPADHDYPFVQAQGAGVVEIPVGPVHAGIIEPGHFRFQAVGETVLNLEERLGYVHKGIEKIAVGREPAALARLAGRISGDCTVAHTWAACQAMERAAGIEVPARALWLRALMAERERVANHLGDVGAICNDVGFAFAQYQLTRLRENLLRENLALFGHRLLMDRIVPGGVAVDIAPHAAGAMRSDALALAAEVAELVAILEGSESLEDRLMGTGRLEPETARALGALGYVGKASGQAFDVRRDAAYPPYDQLEVRVSAYRAGDVAARAKVRADEIGISLALIAELLDSLPAGELRADWRATQPGCEGMGFVESWRGEIVTYLRFDAEGRVARFFPRDPSWLTWPALELLVQGNIVPDFPVCNKSVNGSYSGHDL